MCAHPRIGVAIPAYNRENYLRILLNSIPREIEVLVSDNGNHCSNQFKKEFSNRVFIGSDTVIDVVKNWNRAASNLNTDWICVASDDDVFFENAFDLVTAYINKYPDAEMLIFGHKNIDEDGVEINKWKVHELKVSNAPDGYDVFKYGVDARVISIFFKKSLYDSIGGFDETYKITATDSDFIQTALLSSKSVVVPEYIAGYRVWKKSMTGQLIATKEWISEVIYWQSKISTLLQQLNYGKLRIKRNTNEVIARNLLAGLNSLRKQQKGLTYSTRFLFQFDYPVFATVRTHLKIVQCLLKTALKV